MKTSTLRFLKITIVALLLAVVCLVQAACSGLVPEGGAPSFKPSARDDAARISGSKSEGGPEMWSGEVMDGEGMGGEAYMGDVDVGGGEESGSSEEQYIDFKAQYVRAPYSYEEGEVYPKTAWVTSAGEYEAYFDLFQDAVQTYDDTFFQGHDLLLVIMREVSGSNWHEVTGVKVISGKDGRLTVQPEIDQFVPDMGTCDIAYWVIAIEIGKEYGKASAGEVTPVITTKNLA